MARVEARLGAVFLLGILASGCREALPTSTSCVDIGVFGILVRTFDAGTGAPVTVNGTAVATDGSYREETVGYSYQGGAVAYSLAAERAGRYRVTISVPGYQIWSRDVNVTQGVCHVEPVTVDARLSH